MSVAGSMLAFDSSNRVSSPALVILTRSLWVLAGQAGGQAGYYLGGVL